MGFHRKLLLAASLAIAGSMPAAAQTPPGPSLFGFYNPATGAFQPAPLGAAAPAPTDAAAPAAIVDRRGRITFEIRIVIRSNIGATTEPGCQASLSHSSQQLFFSESVSGASNRVGNTATCTLRIPYRWPEASTTSPVNASIGVFGGNRSQSHGVRVFPLPPDGADITINVNTIL